MVTIRLKPASMKRRFRRAAGKAFGDARHTIKKQNIIMMKTLKIFLVGLIALVGVAISNTSNAQPGFRASISFNDFYNELSPHGRWTTMPRYGQVWIYNEPGFRPYYTNGQWMDTDLGYSWSSGYSWGWAPFHYGRWEFDPHYGWFWIPGYEYAPAWVLWSQADDYYGWAPLGFGIDINISIGKIPSNRWMYAPRGYIGYSRIDQYCVPYNRVNVYYQRQRPITNVYVYNNVRYDRGPGKNFDNRSNRDRNNNSNGSRPEHRTQDNNNNNRSNAGRPQNNRPQNNVPASENRRPEINNRPNNNRPEIATRPQVNRPDVTNRSEPRNYSNGREAIRERAQAQNTQQRPVERTQPSRVYRGESNNLSSGRNFNNARPSQNLRISKAEVRR